MLYCCIWNIEDIDNTNLVGNKIMDRILMKGSVK